jgi:hypothetical protein
VESDSPLELPRSTKAVQRDEKLNLIRQFLQSPRRPEEMSDSEYQAFIRQAMNYFVQGRRLYRKTVGGGTQLVPSPERRLEIVRLAHDNLGHKGVYATVQMLLLRVWWLELSKQVQWFIRSCHKCQL